MRGVGNRHLQTMLPRLIRRKLGFTPHWQRLELPDGDFVDLAWSEDPPGRNTNLDWWCSTGWRVACTAPMLMALSMQPCSAAGWAW